MTSYHDESPKSVFDKLSEDVITEILTRIPSKPLCRFKSVSKRFNSIISRPHFLPLHVSRAGHPSSWVILDRVPKLAPESTHPTQFQFFDPPEISTCVINHRKLGANLVTDPARSNTPAVILHSSNGLILVSVSVNRDPHKEREKDPTNLALYVVNPIKSEWVGLPNPIVDRAHAAFTVRVDPETGIVGRFMVVEYQPVHGSEYGWVSCFVSDTGKWVKKTANYMLGMHLWKMYGSFEFDGKLFWIDLSVGLITWDVKNNDYFKSVESDETAVCRFIPLPKERMKPFNTPGLLDERWVGGGGGFVQFMEVFKEKHCMLKLWRLKDFEVGGEWSLMYKVSRENVGRFLPYGEVPVPSFINPLEADVGYFETGDSILSINLRSQEVEYVKFTKHTNVLPFVLPEWPSSIPKRVYVACAKEHGNECFKSRDFTKAIEFYSKSVDLSPNTATFANRAMAYLKVNKYEEAENDCTESLKLDANYFKVYWRRALARKELGNLEGALEDVEFALKLEPENGEVKKLQAKLTSMLEKVSSAGSDAGTEVSACCMDMKADGN